MSMATAGGRPSYRALVAHDGVATHEISAAAMRMAFLASLRRRALPHASWPRTPPTQLRHHGSVG
jgi:hypothetical protein